MTKDELRIWRSDVSEGAKGKTIESLEWSEEPDGGDGYWVMTFTDGSEITWSLSMAEVDMGIRR